ncbi:MAG: TetR/AcrR family transcriptional regulator [Thermoleophilaceae bacterium]|nr:TetR/AcrR family transcriptional regulator [Thermoleophilaceae bacterium]
MSVAPAQRLAPAQRRQQLVEVAFELFGKRGYEDVALEDVAEAAGVKRGLIYHYFPAGKPDLFAGALAEGLTRGIGQVDVDPDRGIDEKLPRNVKMFLDLAENNDPIYRIFRDARRIEHPSFTPVIEGIREALARDIAFNHLGTREPAPAVLVALEGWQAMMATMMDVWVDKGNVTRAELEELITTLLPRIIETAAAVER